MQPDREGGRAFIHSQPHRFSRYTGLMPQRPYRIHAFLTACIVATAWTVPAFAEPDATVEQSPSAEAPVQHPVTPEVEASVLRPRFKVGQRAVIGLTNRASRRGTSLQRTIDVEVIEQAEGATVLRWHERPIDHPRLLELSPGLRDAIRAPVPYLDIIFTDNVGVTGIRNWQAAFDGYNDYLLSCDLQAPTFDGKAVDPAPLIAKREELRSTPRDAAEAWLLKEVRGYFRGAFRPVRPGQKVEIEEQLPFELDEDAVATIPFLLTVSLDTPIGNPPKEYRCRITSRFHPEKSREPLRDVLFKLASDRPEFQGVKEDELRDALSKATATMTGDTTAEWILDVERGWPSAASETTEFQKRFKQLEWKLISLTDEPPAKQEPAQAPE